MKYLSIFSVVFFLYSLNNSNIDCYRSMRFSSINNNSANDTNVNANAKANVNVNISEEIPKSNIGNELKEVDDITNQLVYNKPEEGEEPEDIDEDEETNERTSFDKVAHESIENIEGDAVLEYENAEIEDLLDNEIFRVVQDRLKKLWYIGFCIRDYTNLCPLGWNKSLYDEYLCIPPKTYQGQCRSMDFKNSEPKDKELFAWKCEVEWPCIQSPSLKVMNTCPNRWTNIKENFCIAPEDYNGDCPPVIDFSDFTFDMRIRWAQLCNFEWPIDLSKVISRPTKMRRTVGGPIEESGEVIKIEHSYNY